MSPEKLPPGAVGFSILCQPEIAEALRTFSKNSRTPLARHTVAFRSFVQLAAIAPTTLQKYPEHSRRFNDYFASDSDVCIAVMQVYRRAVFTPASTKAACLAALTLNWIGDAKPENYLEQWRTGTLPAPPEVPTPAHECDPCLLWGEGVRVPYKYARQPTKGNLEDAIRTLRAEWAKEWSKLAGGDGLKWAKKAAKNGTPIEAAHAARVIKYAPAILKKRR